MCFSDKAAGATCKTRGCSPVIAVAHSNVSVLNRFFDGVSEQSHFVTILSGRAIHMQKVSNETTEASQNKATM